MNEVTQEMVITPKEGGDDWRVRLTANPSASGFDAVLFLDRAANPTDDS